jgi:hypothetical protein
LGGACKNAKRCPYADFIQFINDNSVNSTVYQSVCGKTPEEIFSGKVANFRATLNEAKIVKKNQWLRVIELYAVMLVIILVSWKIYSIFCGNKD